MRIFARGLVVGLAVAFIIMLFFPDMDSRLSDMTIQAAFVCGAVTEVINQLREPERRASR